VTYYTRYWKEYEIFVKEVLTVECARYNKVASVRIFSWVLGCVALTDKLLELGIGRDPHRTPIVDELTY